jgi:3-oxoacyl-[acyl-carrier protein] reductase
MPIIIDYLLIIEKYSFQLPTSIQDFSLTGKTPILTNSVLLDGYVNNAAVAYDDIITNLQIDKLRAMYNVNVFSPMLLTKYAIRNMLLHHTQGSIIHISSISVHTGYKGLSMYASSKGALEAFSKDTAREWGQLGIRSNVVVPGFMETAMSSSLTEEQKDRIYKRTSLKQATDVRSVAETVAFLLSKKACSITGQNIFVDNGTI